MGKFPTYKLTDTQLRGIACIVAHEQGTIAGWFAEASQIANLAEIRYGGDLVKAVTSGWYAKGKARYKAGTTNPVILAIVRRALIEGYRTLPRYINEHDCMSDISTVKDGGKSVKSDKSKWKRHTTVIHNRMGSTYYFWDFPGGYKSGVDPFGYTNKKLREKYGDFCYSVEDAWAPIPRVLAFAFNEIGYLEKKSNKDLTSKTDNAGKKNYTKFGSWIGANGDYWCASFLSWLFYEAFGTDKGKNLLCGTFSAACETIRKNFIKKKQYHTSDPKVGDVIFFSGSRHSGANHIGIVYQVRNGKVYTIEGNTSGASGVVDNGGGVAKKYYLVKQAKILGYGRPDYSIVEGKKKQNSDTVKKETEAKETSTQTECYKKYTGKSNSLVDALKSVGISDTSLTHRQKIAEKNGIKDYSGTASQNIKMLSLLKEGKLKKG